MYLEERLQDVEQQLKNMNRNGGALISRVESLERTVYNCTPDALKEPVTQKDVDRWRAIEKAAEDVVDAWDGAQLFEEKYGLKGRSPKLGELRTALKK